MLRKLQYKICSSYDTSSNTAKVGVKHHTINEKNIDTVRKFLLL